MTSIEKKYIVKDKNIKMWCLEVEEKVIDNQVVPFMQVSKWDRGLVRFCIGKALNFDTGVNINCKFMEDFQDARTKASHESFWQAMQMDSDDEDSPDKKKKKAAVPKSKPKKADSAIVNPIVLAEVTDVDGRPMQVRCLWGVKNSDVYMEANLSNLEWLRAKVQKSLADDEAGRHWDKDKAMENKGKKRSSDAAPSSI